MVKLPPLSFFRKPTTIGLAAGIIGTCLIPEYLETNPAVSAPSFLEYRWDQSSKYKRLYYTQSSNKKRQRASYYLVFRPKDRRTAILKLKITIPDYFDATIRPKKLSLCKDKVGFLKQKEDT